MELNILFNVKKQKTFRNQQTLYTDVSLSVLSSSSDIDECVDGFVECDSKSTCVNLPGWYHCECRDGYHDNGLFSANGESCVGKLHAFNKISKVRKKRARILIFTDM